MFVSQPHLTYMDIWDFDYNFNVIINMQCLHINSLPDVNAKIGPEVITL